MEFSRPPGAQFLGRAFLVDFMARVDAALKLIADSAGPEVAVAPGARLARVAVSEASAAVAWVYTWFAEISLGRQNPSQTAPIRDAGTHGSHS
jgi:hypothetical protein